MQAWISTRDYTVYKVRYTNNMLATGTYDENDVYEDYITLNKEKNTEQISIGSFVDSQECNIKTETNEIQATVKKRKIYIEFEEYEMHIKNITDKTIALDTLESYATIWLVANGGTLYYPYKNSISKNSLIIEPGENNIITIRFMKSLSSNKTSDRIQFSKAIKDYDAYLEIENKEEYSDFAEIKIKVED